MESEEHSSSGSERHRRRSSKRGTRGEKAVTGEGTLDAIEEEEPENSSDTAGPTINRRSRGPKHAGKDPDDIDTAGPTIHRRSRGSKHIAKDPDDSDTAGLTISERSKASKNDAEDPDYDEEEADDERVKTRRWGVDAMPLPQHGQGTIYLDGGYHAVQAQNVDGTAAQDSETWQQWSRLANALYFDDPKWSDKMPPNAPLRVPRAWKFFGIGPHVTIKPPDIPIGTNVSFEFTGKVDIWVEKRRPVNVTWVGLQIKFPNNEVECKPRNFCHMSIGQSDVSA